MSSAQADYQLWRQVQGTWQDWKQLIVEDLLLPALLLLLITLWWYVTQYQAPKKPPGPWSWPIVGNLPTISLSKKLPHQTLRDLAAKYGGFMYLRLGSMPCIVVSTAAAAKELFRTNDAIFCGRPTKLMWTILGGGSTEYKSLASAAPDGPYWRQLRKLCRTELFSPKRHASYEKVRTEEIHHMMKLLLEDSRNGDTAINLKVWLYGVNANNMTRMLVNKRYFGRGAKYEEEKKDLELAVTRAFTGFAAFIISDYVPWLSFVTKLQGWHSEFEDIRQFELSVLTKMCEVEKHREQARVRLEKNDEDYVPDFVDLLSAILQEDGKPLPDNEILVNLVDLMNGGTETSSTTIEWGMRELILHPDVMKRAQDELDLMVGANRLVRESDIPNLPYLQAIVKETFRLHTAVALAIPRQSTRASNDVLGYKLPARTHLILNLHAIHRDPSVYENPDTFNPDRFVGNHHPGVNPTLGFDSYELIPFSAGRRMCPAAALGSLMVSLLMAHLLHSFDWALPEECNTSCAKWWEESFGLTVCPKIPLSLGPVYTMDHEVGPCQMSFSHGPTWWSNFGGPSYRKCIFLRHWAPD